MTDEQIKKMAEQVSSGRRVRQGEDRGRFVRKDGRLRNARSLSIQPQDAYDEKTDAIRAALAERGAAVGSRTEAVIFAINVACEVLGVES